MRVPTIARVAMAVIGLVALAAAAALVVGMVPEGWRWKPALADVMPKPTSALRWAAPA